MKNKTKNKIKKGIVVNMSTDERIRILVNLIIDRILQDKKSGVLRFKKGSSTMGE